MQFSNVQNLFATGQQVQKLLNVDLTVAYI